MIKKYCLFGLALMLTGCAPEEKAELEQKEIVRGLKAIVVGGDAHTMTRRFPSVLEPAESSSVGFQISGRLDKINLKVGQTVSNGELIAELDDEAAKIQVASAQSSVKQAKVKADNASDNLARQQKLLSRGTVTRVAVDNAKVEATSNALALVQAQQAVDSAKESATKTKLYAPFDGVVSAVMAEAFTTVSAGSPIAKINRDGGFEVKFSVNYNTVNLLQVGQAVNLQLADDPNRELKGVITELGNSADAVSTFPVVVGIDKSATGIKSGMAVEAQLTFEIPSSTGFSLPFTAAVIDGTADVRQHALDTTEIEVFVYDPQKQVVNKRKVTTAGIQDNSFLVISGLSAGDRVASAGVSFLTDGQPVKLLED